MSRRDQVRFTPRLEVLEDRAQPAVSVVQTGATLAFTGDSAADLISINQGAGAVTVRTNGFNVGPYVGVDTIILDTGAGADVVQYTLSGPLGAPRVGGQTLRLRATLGGGRDIFVARIQTAIPDDTHIEMLLDGGDQADIINVIAHTSGRPIDLGVNALLSVQAVGGGDNDAIKFHYKGLVGATSSVVFAADGGSGRDTISCDMTARSPSDGVLRANLHGGDDNDRLITSLRRLHPLNTTRFEGVLDGGEGRDSALHTSNIAAVNVETNSLLPGMASL